MQIYSTREAAAYLGISVPALKFYIRQGRLQPAKVGHSLVFTQNQLDAFKPTMRPSGRPRKE